jgi:hypothetical protein
MKKHVRLVVVAATLCCPPILSLSPMLFGAGNECNEYAKNIPCNYSVGCTLQIRYCTNYDETDCETIGTNTTLQANLFTCAPTTNNTSCDPVTDSGGKIASTVCVNIYNCIWDPVDNVCIAWNQQTPCYAPYYKTTQCP